MTWAMAITLSRFYKASSSFLMKQQPSKIGNLLCGRRVLHGPGSSSFQNLMTDRPMSVESSLRENVDNVKKDFEKTVQRNYTVHVLEGGSRSAGVQYAIAETQGRRNGMEDAHAAVLKLGEDASSPTSLFGVFDGHAGKEPAQVLRAPSYAAGRYPAALREAFLSLDAMMRDQQHQAELWAVRHDVPVPEPEHPKKTAREAGQLADAPAGPGDIPLAKVNDPYSQARSQEVHAALPERAKEQASGYGSFTPAGQYVGPRAGSTAVVALVRQGHLWVASVGDSRCVLCHNGKALSLTRDHKPNQPQEAARVHAAGEFVAAKRGGGIPRVGGTLAMSRAMGDVRYKTNVDLPPEQQAVTAEPDTSAVKLSSATDFMVLACDGVWDVLSEEQVVQEVDRRLSQGKSLASVCQSLVEQCLGQATGKGPSQDNITFMIVTFSDRLKD